MSPFKEFVESHLSSGANEALAKIGVYSFETVGKKTFGQLREALNHDDATRLWGRINHVKPPSKQPPKMLRVGEDTFLSPELTKEALAKTEEFLRENPEQVAEAMISPGVSLSTEPKAWGDGLLAMHRLVVQQLSQVEDSCKALFVRLDALEEKVRVYEARHAQEHPPVGASTPPQSNEKRVGQVWEQGNARAQAPIGTE